MPALILLNGPPASGKSTLAARFVESRPLALRLDIDVIRGLLGGWIDEPLSAGFAARDLAVEMAAAHLASGHDVVVPQFLGKADFIERLQQVANASGADFYEVALMVDRAAAVAAFDERRKNPADQTHLDAAALVDRSEHADPVGAMWDQLHELLQARPQTLRVSVVRDDIDTTFEALIAALNERGLAS